MRLNTPLTQVDTTQQYEFGSRTQDKDGNEYIYLTGVASTIVGSWVTYDELGITALLVADAIGSIAVAMAIIDATTDFGWYQIYGSAEAAIALDSTADAAIGFETTSGYAGDGNAAGDLIYGAVLRDTVAAGAAAVVTVQLNYPFVDDNSN